MQVREQLKHRALHTLEKRLDQITKKNREKERKRIGYCLWYFKTLHSILNVRLTTHSIENATHKNGITPYCIYTMQVGEALCLCRMGITDYIIFPFSQV